MSKRKKHLRRQIRTFAAPPSRPTGPLRPSSVSRLVAWLGSAGILALLLSAAYQHFFGNITLEFVQALSRGYEFQFKNDTPSDRMIEKFRVVFPEQDKVIYKLTQDIPVYQSSPDSASLPDGNTHEVPAARFKELDGRVLFANNTLKFRIPPLSDHSWVEPDATIVEFQYSIAPANAILATIDRALSPVGLETKSRKIRYLVLNNYWVPATSDSPHEAIRIACRDDATIRKLSVCNGWR